MTPVFVCCDRYNGTYAGGSWWAIANADAAYGDGTRLDWVLLNDDGPWSDDTAVVGFWSNPPDWIAVGDTPDQACAAIADRDPREQLLARGRCHRSWQGLEFVSGRNRAGTFDWYAERPRQPLHISVAALQNKHAAPLSSEAWIAFIVDPTPAKVWQRLLGDEDDILWLLAEEKDTYRSGATPQASIRNLVDELARRRAPE